VDIKESDMKRYIRRRDGWPIGCAMGSARKPEIGRQLGLRMRNGHISPFSGRRLSRLQFGAVAA